MHIGIKIKEKRLEQGLTQEELAKRIGYKDRTTIAKIETGKSDVTQTKVIEFAKALHTTPAYLMGWEENDDDDEQHVFSEVDDMTNELFEKHKLLFSKTKNASVNDMKKIIAIVDALMGDKNDE